MSFYEHDMYPYVSKNLRRRYPKHEGWNIYDKDRWSGYEPDFVVERKGLKIERTIVEVKVTCRVSQSHIDQLNSYVRNLAGGNVKIVEKILVVPSGTDISIVPNDMNIMFLKSFKCESDGIVWYR